MKTVCMLIVFTAFFAVPALAGEIWGIIRQNGKPQPELTVKVFQKVDDKSTESKPIARTETDKWGVYSVFIEPNKESGLYELVVCDEKDDKSCKREIYKREIGSSKAPVRCDIHLLSNGQN
jgi:hypothetical protein